MDKKKVKYYERNPMDSNCVFNKEKINKLVENESNLIMPSDSNTTSNKTLFEYEELNTQSYNTPLKISEINIKKQFGNYYGHHIGPGKGFGNLNVSNDIRQGSSTRLDNFENKINKEKEINSRYDYVDKNFQNPNNLILPFARGGEITRKSLKADKYEDPMIPDDNNMFTDEQYLGSTIQYGNNVKSNNSIEDKSILRNETNTMYYNKTKQYTDLIDDTERMSYSNSFNNTKDKKSKYKFNY
tara:strand:- start:1324 stop:2049 length:726 start_codon:yes stop_codon:yes gene_type:complete